MANIHVLNSQGVDYRVAIHIAIPNANNSAGFNWRTMLLRSGLGGTTILTDGDGTGGTISASEKALIVSGALYEMITTIRVDSAGANVNAYLDAEYTRISNETLLRLQDMLKYYGYTR